jgi:hypothetical protein
MRSALPTLALACLVAACGGGEVDGDGNPMTGGSGGQAAGGGLAPGNGGSGNRPGQGGTPPGLGGTSSTGGQSTHEPEPGFTLDCAASKPGKPVLRLLTRTEVDSSLNAIFPELKGEWTNSLPASNVSKLGFDNDARAEVSTQFASALLETAESLSTALVGSKLATLVPCASAGDKACATSFLSTYGRRLFRRPLTTDESQKYLAFFDSALAKSDFKTALKWMTIGLIQSPNAVYRSEVGTASGGARKLDPHELATELAFTFTGAPPSEELLDKADSGDLGDRLAVAKELLATEAGKLQFQRFFEAYTGFPRVSAISKPNVQDFATVSTDMVQETRRFIDDVLVQKEGGVRELLTADTTNPSQRLAQFYGFSAPGADYTSVARPAGKGVGLLAQGSFLATRSSSNVSSPTQRGLFVFTRLLCRTPPSPPDTVPPLATGSGAQLTTRQRYEQAHAQGTCSSCHQLFDPIGFGFEHFDEAGRYRDQEFGMPVDSKSHVPEVDRSVAFEFDDQEGLMTGLADRIEVYQCFANYLATYAFGTNDACLGTSQVENMKNGTVGIRDAFASLATEPHFSQRSSQ